MEKINSTKILGFEEFAEKFSKVDISQKKYNSGGIILATDNQNVYVDDSDSHSIVFGSTGSKKTRMLIMPTIEILKRAGESFIVTDPKGEICQKTAGDLYKFGYHKIIINFREFNKGYKWNPLSLAYDNYHRKICRVFWDNLKEISYIPICSELELLFKDGEVVALSNLLLGECLLKWE